MVRKSKEPVQIKEEVDELRQEVRTKFGESQEDLRMELAEIKKQMVEQQVKLDLVLDLVKTMATKLQEVQLVTKLEEVQLVSVNELARGVMRSVTEQDSVQREENVENLEEEPCTSNFGRKGTYVLTSTPEKEQENQDGKEEKASEFSEDNEILGDFEKSIRSSLEEKEEESNECDEGEIEQGDTKPEDASMETDSKKHMKEDSFEERHSEDVDARLHREAVKVDEMIKTLEVRGLSLGNKWIESLRMSTREKGVQEISMDEFQDFVQKLQKIVEDGEMNMREKEIAVAQIIESVGERTVDCQGDAPERHRGIG